MSSNLRSLPTTMLPWTKNHRDNGASPPHDTQPSSPHSPLTDALVDPDKPPLLPHIDFSDTTRLVIAENYPEVRLKAAYNALFGVYQDWVHQNPWNNLYGEIKENGKWQYRWRKLVCFTTLYYDVPSGQSGGRAFFSILSVEINVMRDLK